jgi:hypothetical protein
LFCNFVEYKFKKVLTNDLWGDILNPDSMNDSSIKQKTGGNKDEE